MEHKTYPYKKMSHFKDISTKTLTNTHNETNNIIHYTDKQFNEDLEKWFNETKTIQNDKVITKIQNIITNFK
jgi:hypothetical protein